jgi:hypothetical protein
MAHSREKILKSPVVKRSINIAGHKTSVTLEGEFWNSLKEIARERNMTLAELGQRDRRRSAICQSIVSHSPFCAWRLSRSGCRSPRQNARGVA